MFIYMDQLFDNKFQMQTRILNSYIKPCIKFIRLLYQLTHEFKYCYHIAKIFAESSAKTPKI
jgi:ubiquinone biosynthesis protein Coq4